MTAHKRIRVWVVKDDEHYTYLFKHNPLVRNAAGIRSLDVTDVPWLLQGLNLRPGQCRELEIREISEDSDNRISRGGA